MRDGSTAAGRSGSEETPEPGVFSGVRRRFFRLVPRPVRRNLLAKLLILLFVGAVISGAVLAVAYVTINDDITEQVKQQVESDTTVQATVYENWLTERWTTLAAMARADGMHHESRSVVHQWLVAEQTGISEDVHSLHVVDADTGEVFGSTKTGYAGLDLYERGLGQTNAESLIFISRRPIELEADRPTMTLVGVRSGDRLLVAAVPTNTSLVESQAFDGATSSLRSLDGVTLIGNTTTGQMTLPAQLGEGTTVLDRGDCVVGVRIIAHDVLDAEPTDKHDPETTTRTVVVTRTSKEQAFAVRDQISRGLVVAFGLTFVLLIGTAVVSMRSVTADVNRLSERARRIKEGSFDVDVSSDRLDEIGTLYRSVGEMRDSLQRRIQLAEKREREMEQARNEADRAREELRQVIDLVPDLIFARDREGRYLLANEATAKGYGLPPEEVEGKQIEELHSRDQVKQFRERDLEVIESGEPVYIPEEEVTFNGESRVHQTTKIPYQPAGSDSDAVLGYARDVTELKEYERQLEAQRDNLDVLNKMVRHDIRNEIQIIRAYAETLEAHVDEAGEEYVEQVLNSARYAADITETARDVAEVMVQADAELAAVNFRHVIETEIEDVRASHETAVVRCEGTIPDVEVLADDLFESVIRNLLKNAIDHNDEEVPRTAVSVTRTDGDVVLRVADNGPGIPDDRKEAIFEEGEQGLDSDGTGLGLYLVRTLVDRYGGEVWVEDNDPTGAAFYVELPIHS